MTAAFLRTPVGCTCLQGGQAFLDLRWGPLMLLAAPSQRIGGFSRPFMLRDLGSAQQAGWSP